MTPSSRVRLALVGLIFVSVATQAQQQGGDASEQGVSGKAALGYLSTSGNTESTNANAALNVTYTLPIWRHDFDITAVNASTDDATTAEAYTADYEGRRSFGERSFLFTALDWKRDRFSAFEQQVSETVGYGRRLIARERHTLDAGIGGGARQSTLLDGTRERDAILRGSAEYVWALSEGSEFNQRLVVESGSTNTMTEAVSALRTRLFGNVGIVLSFRLRRNSEVPVGIEATDRFTSIALEYAW